MKWILLTILMLAGCGGSQQNTRVRLASLPSSLAHMLAALTDSLGYYQEEGVPVTLEILPNTAKCLEALLSGSIDVTSTTFGLTIQMAAQGRDVRAFVLGTVRETQAIIVPESRPHIRSVSDLRGRTVGVAGLGASTHQFLNFVLAKNDIRADEVSTAGVGAGRAAIAAFERGMVDASVVSSGEYFRMKAKFPRMVVLADVSTPDGSKAIYGSESYPGVVLAARSEWLRAHPEQARRMGRAVKRTLAWLRDHSPEQIRERMPADYRTDDVTGDIESLRTMKTVYSPDGVIPHAGAQTVLRALSGTQEEIRRATIDLSKTYTNEFVAQKGGEFGKD